MTLNNVVISEIQLHLGEGGTPDLETIRLSFSEFIEEYIPQNKIGSGGGAVRQGYSVTKRIKL